MRKIIIAIFLCCVHLGFAQDSLVIKYANTITQDELFYHLNIIASDEFEGRNTGEKGQKLAAEYISKEFKNDNLTGPVKKADNPYLQEFELAKKTWEKISVKSSVYEFEFLKDFFVVGNLKPGDQTYEVIFAGYGLSDDKYSDYEKIDVTGKFVAVLLGEPMDKKGNYIISGTDEPSLPSSDNLNGKMEQLGLKSGIAAGFGAAGIIIIEKSDEAANGLIQMIGPYLNRPQIGFMENNGNGEYYGVIYTSPSVAAKMFGVEIEKFNKTVEAISKKKKSTAGKLKETLFISANQTADKFTTENVLGFIEGTDKKDEIIVLTAHYDHMGIMGDQIYNGADDNGTGTVSVLEIGEAFMKAKEDGYGPRRSMLFMAVTAEEIGLFGSQYYCDNPLFPIDNTVANLNMDMIGRSDTIHEDNPNFVYIIGSDMASSELHQIHEEAAKIYTPFLELDYSHNTKDDPERWYYRSDQISFARKGVPVIFYNTGDHEDLHKPTDTVDKIDFEKFEMICKLIFATAWELANREDRIVIDVKEE